MAVVNLMECREAGALLLDISKVIDLDDLAQIDKEVMNLYPAVTGISTGPSDDGSIWRRYHLF